MIFTFCFRYSNYGAHCAPLQTVAFQMVRRKRILVEMRRVELLSNILSIPTSPSAVYCKDSLNNNTTNKFTKKVVI